ncbi:hypothetical protein LTS12_020582, partial [Elasticomyces elasticus]
AANTLANLSLPLLQSDVSMITRELSSVPVSTMALNGRGAYDTTGTPKPPKPTGNGSTKKR